MNRMLRIVSCCLCAVVCGGASVGAMAATEPQSAEAQDAAEQIAQLDTSELTATQKQEVMEAAEYAYMDMDAVSDTATQEKIEDARRVIIYSQSWVAEEEDSAAVIDVRTGEVLEELPHFYDIFPSDWDVPTDNG